MDARHAPQPARAAVEHAGQAEGQRDSQVGGQDNRLLVITVGGVLGADQVGEEVGLHQRQGDQQRQGQAGETARRPGSGPEKDYRRQQSHRCITPHTPAVERVAASAQPKTDHVCGSQQVGQQEQHSDGVRRARQRGPPQVRRPYVETTHPPGGDPRQHGEPAQQPRLQRAARLLRHGVNVKLQQRALHGAISQA